MPVRSPLLLAVFACLAHRRPRGRRAARQRHARRGPELEPTARSITTEYDAFGLIFSQAATLFQHDRRQPAELASARRDLVGAVKRADRDPGHGRARGGDVAGDRRGRHSTSCSNVFVEGFDCSGSSLGIVSRAEPGQRPARPLAVHGSPRPGSSSFRVFTPPETPDRYGVPQDIDLGGGPRRA